MKTAEECFKKLDLLGIISMNEKQDEQYKVLIRATQLDAFKAGMEYAAKLFKEQVSHQDGQIKFESDKDKYQHILTTTQSLTQIPKEL